MSTGESKTETQTQQVNQIPQWVTNAGEANYGFAQDVASQPLTQYQGQMVADVSPQTQQAWDLAASSGNVGQDQYGASQAGFLNSIGQNINQVTDPGNASMIKAGQLSKTNLDPYMNPYTKSVIDATLPIYQQNLGLSQIGNQNAASSSNAFGGSRQGVQQAVTQAQGAQGMAQMAQQLNAANFGQAQSAAQQDIANRLTASTANQGAQQQNLNRNVAVQQGNQGAAQAKINSDILSSQGLANLGDSQTRANAANFTMLSQAGASESQQAQNQINASMAKFNEARNYPNQQLATLLSALGMTPHDTATTGTSSTQQETPTNWGALALGGLDDLSGFFKPTSDKEGKTDITKLKKDKTTGLPLYAFRYKGDPKTYPKVVGPMAQDVEKRFPGATQRQGGRLTVDPSIMASSGVKGYAMGVTSVPAVPKIPGALAMGSDTVPAMLTPGEAVLNQKAATTLGRGKIAQLNMGTPPSSPLVAAGLKTTLPRTLASFMPPKRAFSAATTAPRAGAKAFGGLANTKTRVPVRGALA